MTEKEPHKEGRTHLSMFQSIIRIKIFGFQNVYVDTFCVRFYVRFYVTFYVDQRPPREMGKWFLCKLQRILALTLVHFDKLTLNETSLIDVYKQWRRQMRNVPLLPSCPPLSPLTIAGGGFD